LTFLHVKCIVPYMEGSR